MSSPAVEEDIECEDDKSELAAESESDKSDDADFIDHSDVTKGQVGRIARVLVVGDSAEQCRFFAVQRAAESVMALDMFEGP